MFLWLYNLCFPVVFLALLPGYLWKMVRRGDYRTQFGQRFGWYSTEVKARLVLQPARLWLQAVSVGEMLIALKLIAALREQSPGLPLILSTTTTTGLRLAQGRAGADVEVIYTPIDLLPIVRHAFHVLKPAAVVIVDGGLWPNLLSEARRRKLPTTLVNARLSPRSERRFRRFPFFSAPMFRLLDLVCVSERTDVERWARLGILKERIQHTGSIKYDDRTTGERDARDNDTCLDTSKAQPWQNILAALNVAPDRRILLAGSTHAGEEIILIRSYLELHKEFSDLFLIIAPRHVERTTAIIDEIKPYGLQIARCTTVKAEAFHRTTTSSLPPPDLMLLDTTGELKDWYAAATIVFIGKSLTAIGGQNPAEAIMAGKPVVTGPHMENFGDLMQALLAENAVIQIPDSAALPQACARLLNDTGLRTHMATAASRQLEAHRGASARSAALVLKQPKYFTC